MFILSGQPVWIVAGMSTLTYFLNFKLHFRSNIIMKLLRRVHLSRVCCLQIGRIETILCKFRFNISDIVDWLSHCYHLFAMNFELIVEMYKIYPVFLLFILKNSVIGDSSN